MQRPSPSRRFATGPSLSRRERGIQADPSPTSLLLLIAMPPHSRLDATAATIMVVLGSLWALNQVAIKVALTGIPPLLQGGLRSLGAAALVWAWSALRGVNLFERGAPHGLGLVIGLLFAGEFM